MKKVLICEDEQNIRELIAINLKIAGYETMEAGNAEEALKLFADADEKPDVAVLDIMMPGSMNGIALCKELRKLSDFMGIIMLTAKVQESDKILGLTSGADDYMTKPFSPSELVARVAALYRRVSIYAEKDSSFKRELVSGEFLIDMKSHKLFKNGMEIDLTQVEYALVEYFMERPGVDIPREQLLRSIWGETYAGDEKIVDVNIRRLRMKIEDTPSAPTHLVTVWGKGYKWQ